LNSLRNVSALAADERQEDEMDIPLINSFLDLCALDSGWAEQAVEFGFQNVAEQRGKALSRAEKVHLVRGDEATAEMIRRKALPDAKPEDFKARSLFIDVEEFDVALYGQEIEQTRAMLKLGLHVAADRAHVSVDQLLSETSIEEFALNILQDAIASRTRELQSPDVHRAMLRRFLNRPNSIESQIRPLDDLPVLVDAVPHHLKQLLSNAHESALLGQEVACAVLCGTALEEALHVRLGKDAFSGITAGIKKAYEIGLFEAQTPEAFAAWSIKTAGDQATHRPSEFLKMPTKEKRDLLVNIRFIVAHLFRGIE
jgi:hypothetical protein